MTMPPFGPTSVFNTLSFADKSEHWVEDYAVNRLREYPTYPEVLEVRENNTDLEMA